jgi:hypothetical protein
MKSKINTLLGAVLALLVFTLTTSAATQVYDLKTDWSDTQNPNGTWSYRSSDGSLLPNDSFPWGYEGGLGNTVALTRITGAAVVPGYLEAGDVSARLDSTPEGGVTARWTAPARGAINISGGLWAGDPDIFYFTSWTLTRNGIALSDGFVGFGNRTSPSDLSYGSAGANGLLNIQVEAGDQVELALLNFGASGMNFTISFTPDSVDPITAIEGLAVTVIQMNLQNGIENSLDSKLDAAVNALMDANVNNDGAACNSLASFISAVEAQRGKKITSAQADQLIAAAQQIKTALNCGN